MPQPLPCARSVGTTPTPLPRPGVIWASDGRLTISVPIQIKRRSGRKLVALPNGEKRGPGWWADEPTPMQLALARGHWWLAMLKSGGVKSLRELAREEGVDSSYVSRMVNLTTLQWNRIETIILDHELNPAADRWGGFSATSGVPAITPGLYHPAG